MRGRSHRLQSHDQPEDWVNGSWTVDCVCGVNFDDGEEMVNCDECGVWVHTRCSKYVKGEELFACDKCKGKGNGSRNGNDSEETEVAQLLVELPTKTIRLEGNYPPVPYRPFKLWAERPMEERVHVQGIPGGDPALFSGLSSVFTPELWRCSGYVPKKFSFRYREFPCWDDEKKDGDGRNEEENENTVNNGAGVLFSLSKEAVLATPAFSGLRGRDEDGGCDRKLYSADLSRWDGEDGQIRRSQFGGVRKDKSVLRSVGVVDSGKRRREDQGISRDRSGKKKARAADKELDAKKRGPHFSRTAFTIASDSKRLESYEDKGSAYFKNDSQGSKDKNLRSPMVQEHDQDGYRAVSNSVEKSKKNWALVDRPSQTRSSEICRLTVSSGARQEEEVKAGMQVPSNVKSSSKLDNVGVSVPVQSDTGRMPLKQERDNMPNNNIDDNVEGPIGSDVKHPDDKLTGVVSEINGSKINADNDLGIEQSNVKGPDEGTSSGAVLNSQSPLGDAKDSGMSSEYLSETSKMDDTLLSGSPSSDNKAPEADRISEAVSDCHADKANDLTGDPSQQEQALGASEGSTLIEKCPSEVKDGAGLAKEWAKSGGTASSVVISTSDNLQSVDAQNSNPSPKQQVITDFNSSLEKDRASNDVVRDEYRQDLSRKTVKEHSASKASSSNKISHASVPKRTYSDSKDSMLYSSKGSMHNSYEATGYVQTKASASGIPSRGEKLNQSTSQSLSKGTHASSMNPPAVINSHATLSDEELALLLHQELNSSPRVPRVPRIRHAGSLPQLASSAATSMLIKRTSTSGGKDHNLVSRRKYKDASKDGNHRSYDHEDEAKKTDRVPSSSDLRKQDPGHRADVPSKRDSNGSSLAAQSIKKNISAASASTANSGPSSSTEVNDHHVSSVRKSPRSLSDEEIGTARGPVHRTLPGLINEIMSKGRRMTYEELCNAVLPHWHNLRKHNGERYAYSSHSQAVLDCLRNRVEWAQLVDRGPKTSSGRKKRKPDVDESEDNEYGKGTTNMEGESKSLESQREEFPKGKRKARKRRRLALHGRGVNNLRKRQKADLATDDDSGSFSNSSEESRFSEDEIQGGGAGPVGSEASASTDETGKT